jgi:hypothetical protein
MARFSRRTFVRQSLAVGVAVSVTPRSTFAQANDEIGIGLIGCGGRGGELSQGFKDQAGARIVAVTDPDRGRAGSLAEKLGGPTVHEDLRELLKDPAVDVVVVATCNHWHCLAAIWAMEAGKDVYVEKPLSHSQWEGRQVVAAARRYEKIVQLGTQQRSDPLQVELKKYLHEERALGEIKFAQANRLGPRGTIGKRDTPLPIPGGLNYDLWLGPAEDRPLFRNNLHYDWHWDWNTGSGEMGNWGVHVLDDVRNVAYRDSVSTPRRIVAVGGRVAWNDAGETPNVHYVYFDTGTFPCFIALSNLPASPGDRGGWNAQAGRPVGGPGSGYVVACEGGYLLGQRGSATAYDLAGNKLRMFKGSDMDARHKQNFLDAVRSRDRVSLNAEVEIGHHSSGWCNLANVAFRAAGSFSVDEARARLADDAEWGPLLEEMQTQLAPFGVSESDLRLSAVLEHDPATEQFTGEHAEAANAFLRREYRAGYEVPEIV